MPLDVAAHKRAGGDHVEPLGTHLVERAADQSAADALALERGVDRGVRELDPALAEAVLRDTGELAVEGPANTRQAQAAVLDWCYGFYNQVRRITRSG